MIELYTLSIIRLLFPPLFCLTAEYLLVAIRSAVLIFEALLRCCFLTCTSLDC